MKLIPLKTADEYDAFTKWRSVYIWKPGQIKSIKRRYNKRVRRLSKKELL